MIGSSTAPALSGRLTWLVGLAAILAAVAAVYAPTTLDYFGGDDFLVLGPVHNVGPWELIGRSVILRDNIPYWRPLVSPIYAFEVHVFWLRPWPYHLVVIGLHLANVALLALIAAALTGRRGVGLTAGLLFGIHAAHTMTAAMISSTVELLSVVCYLTTVLLAIRYVQSGRSTTDGSGQPARLPDRRAPRWYWLCVIAFACALLAKESTASAAGVVTLLYFLFIFLPERRAGRFLLSILPFWLLVIPYTVFAYITDTDDPGNVTRLMYAPAGHAWHSFWWLLARLAVPVEAGHGPNMAGAGPVGAALLVAVAATIALYGNASSRFLAAWTAIALTPLALWKPEFLLGRFTYQAAAPYCILMALGGALVVDHAPGGRSGRRRLMMGMVLLMVVAAPLSALTIAQNGERGREAEQYQLLLTALQRDYPAVPRGTEIALINGVWAGPFHALYLDAVADTLYGAGHAHLINIGPGEPLPAAQAPPVARLRYNGVALIPDPHPD